MSDLDDVLSLQPPPDDAVPLYVAEGEARERILGELGPAATAFAAAHGARTGGALVLPDAEGRIAGVLAAPPQADDPYGPLHLGALARSLPGGAYRLVAGDGDERLAGLGWALGGYRFSRYRAAEDERPTLHLADAAAATEAHRQARGVYLARDMINTPASDMGPEEIAGAAETLAGEYGAAYRVTVGDALLAENFPTIHAVGRASPRAPRLAEFTWGDAAAPKVTLVGKGVAFDTGGLDLKSPANMALMKKDMGGAANVLGLAQLLMSAGAPIRLRVLIPAVENAVSGAAFRPGDVITSRKGLRVEINNTDAEGRLILCDALALADEEAPDLLIDMATLTGAARVALGPDLAPMYTNDDDLAGRAEAAGRAGCDPVWRMPLWQPYAAWLKPEVGEIDNAPSGRPGAGSITAALFLSRFVEAAKTWAHFDIYGWSQETRPRGVKGGEAYAIRALDAVIRERYAK